jgi:magnesium-transporting ATPase (P-type)
MFALFCYSLSLTVLVLFCCSHSDKSLFFFMFLLSNRGITTLVNDNLLINALNMLSVVIVVFSALIGVIVTVIFYPSSMWIGAVIGSIIGFFVGFVLTTALDTAIVMVYICFASDPMTLQVRNSFLFPVCYLLTTSFFSLTFRLLLANASSGICSSQKLFGSLLSFYCNDINNTNNLRRWDSTTSLS